MEEDPETVGHEALKNYNPNDSRGFILEVDLVSIEYHDHVNNRTFILFQLSSFFKHERVLND